MKVQKSSFSISNLLIKRQIGTINIDFESGVIKVVSGQRGRIRRWRGKPGRPWLDAGSTRRASFVQSFRLKWRTCAQGTQNGTMNNDRANQFGIDLILAGFSVVYGTAEFKIETNWKLEIQLNRGTLMTTLMCIHNGNVNLGTVEGTISRVQFHGWPNSSRQLEVDARLHPKPPIHPNTFQGASITSNWRRIQRSRKRASRNPNIPASLR